MGWGRLEAWRLGDVLGSHGSHTSAVGVKPLGEAPVSECEWNVQQSWLQRVDVAKNPSLRTSFGERHGCQPLGCEPKFAKITSKK